MNSTCSTHPLTPARLRVFRRLHCDRRMVPEGCRRGGWMHLPASRSLSMQAKKYGKVTVVNAGPDGMTGTVLPARPLHWPVDTRTFSFSPFLPHLLRHTRTLSLSLSFSFSVSPHSLFLVLYLSTVSISLFIKAVYSHARIRSVEGSAVLRQANICLLLCQRNHPWRRVRRASEGACGHGARRGHVLQHSFPARRCAQGAERQGCFISWCCSDISPFPSLEPSSPAPKRILAAAA